MVVLYMKYAVFFLLRFALLSVLGRSNLARNHELERASLVARIGRRPDCLISMKHLPINVEVSWVPGNSKNIPPTASRESCDGSNFVIGSNDEL